MSESIDSALGLILGTTVAALRDLGHEPAEIQGWFDLALKSYERRNDRAAQNAVAPLIEHLRRVNG